MSKLPRRNAVSDARLSPLQRLAIVALIAGLFIADCMPARALQGSSSSSSSRGQVSFSPKRTPETRQDVDLAGTTIEAAMARGATAFKADRFDVAIREYRQAVALDPKSAEAHYWLGLSHYYSDDYSAAADSLKTSVALSPGLSQLYVDLGRALTNLDKYDDAKRTFRTGLVMDAKSAELWTGLGVAQSYAGEVAEGRASLEKARALAPEDCDIAMMAGLLAADARDFEFAIARAMECQSKHKDNPDYWFELARWYAGVGKMDESLICFEKSVRLKPTYKGLVILGDGLSNADRISEALDVYQEAVRLNPTLPEAVTKVGVAYSYLGDYDQALFAMERAVDLDPTSLDAKTTLANCYINAERPTEAVATIAPVLEARPTSPHALACAGEASAYLGAFDQAIGYYERAVRADGNYHEARIWLSICLAGLGRQDDARAQLATVGRTPPAMLAFYERDLPGKKRPALYYAVVAVLRGGAEDYAAVRRSLDAMRAHNQMLSDRVERLLRSVGRLR